jgi:putative molybdopterin biosynthesis protein
MRNNMQINAGLELLTTAEAADYLRLKERKLYELVADRQIPCTKVTGKWLFSRADLDRWLLAGMARPHGIIPAEPPPIVGGSHDPLLQWALNECRAGLAMMPEGSEAGYRRFLKGEVVAAAIHFHDTDSVDADANLCVVQREGGLYDAVLIGVAVREQGLIVAAGNPHGLTSIRDAHNLGLRLVIRPDGAGAQQLLSAVLKREGLTLADFGEPSVAQTGPDVAQAIRAGHADCGIATRAVAASAGIGFLPLCFENFDLVMRQRDYFRPPLQALLRTLGSQFFKERAKDLGGLDVSVAGSVRWSP